MLISSQGRRICCNGAVCHVVRYVSTTGTAFDEIRPLRTTNLSALQRGKGGRSSFSGLVCTVFGATGGLGRAVSNKLGKIGTQLIIPYRQDGHEVRDLKLVGDLGQVLFTPYHLKDEDALRKAIKYSNVVVYSIGRDWETKNYKFDDINHTYPAKIAKMAKEFGVEKFVFVSSLNAAEHPKPHFIKTGSRYLQTKWLGEQAVREVFPEAIIIRPADMYGWMDRFVKYYAAFVRRTTSDRVSLWKKGEHTSKMPVYIGDVAAGIVKAIKDPESAGLTYEAVGPKRYRLCDLITWFYGMMRYDNFKIWDARFDPTVKLRIALIERLSPNFNIGHLSMDKLERECITDTLTGCPTLEDLGITLTEMENRIPYEIKYFKADMSYCDVLGEYSDPPPPKVIATI